MDIGRSQKAGGTILLNADLLCTLKKNGKGTQKYFDRPTAICANYEMHITSLTKKGLSQAAHQHMDTEIILVIDGEVEITIDGKDFKGSTGDLLLPKAVSYMESVMFLIKLESMLPLSGGKTYYNKAGIDYSIFYLF